jgi:transposase
MKGLTLTTKEQTRLCILNSVLAKQCTVAEAAQLMMISERHLWRLLAAYRARGAAALAHGNRNRSPSNMISSLVQEQIISFAHERYQGINHTHLTELLGEREGIKVSRSTVRRILTDAGITSPRHRKSPRHRYRRERMPQEGMLVQIDGSHHHWLEDRGPCLTLLLAIDDATGLVPYALFQEQEDTEGYFRLMKGIIENKGIPLALYSDRHLVFRPAREPDDQHDIGIHTYKGKPTDFGRAMRELGINQIFARSPEAKGRIERANGTFQDRLVAELRLAGATTMSEANLVLAEFLLRFNERFSVPAAQPVTAYRAIDAGSDIDGILCFKERRRVARDNTIQYKGRNLQLFPGTDLRSYARTWVEVQERLDDRIMVYCRGELLTPTDAPPLAKTLRNTSIEEIKAMVSPIVDTMENDTRLPEPRFKGMWYSSQETKELHSNLIKAGMRRALQNGKKIGRPRVSDRADFNERLFNVLERINIGTLSRRKGANELDIGYATLKRIIDAQQLEKKRGEDLLVAIR